jgi:hypothetical protein
LAPKKAFYQVERDGRMLKTKRETHSAARAERLTRRAPDGVDRTALPFICEAITLSAYDELPYVFELQQNEILEFTVRSDTPVDILLCNMADYERWVDSGYDPEIALLVHLEAEDVLAHTLQFTAPQAGEYTVLLMNWTERAADLAIEIPDLLPPALR